MIINNKITRWWFQKVVRGKYCAIAIYPFIFTDRELSEDTINHEKIHFAQQKELWFIVFYYLYIYYYLKNVFVKKQNHDLAYRTIPFEIEAYEHQHNLNYLKDRKKFLWRNYIYKGD